MLKRFDVYVLRQVSRITLLTWFLLIALDFLLQWSAELDENQPLSLVAQALLWHIPEKTILFLPAALLIGSILGLGQLAKSHELTVMQSAGLSRTRLLYPVLGLALFGSASLLLLLEALSPRIQQQQALLQRALGKETQRELWLQRERDYIRVQSLREDGRLAGVELFRLEPEAMLYVQAESASYRNHGWLFHQAIQEHISMNARQHQLGDWFWAQDIAAEDWFHLQRYSLWQGLRESKQRLDFLKENNSYAAKEALQWWQRLLLPLTALTMVYLASPFVFGSQRQAAQGTRLLFGIVLGIAYYLVQTMLANLALLLHWSPALSALAPNLLVCTLLYAIQKTR